MHRTGTHPAMKAKHSLVFILLVSMCIGANAQSDTARKTKSFIAVGFGASLPVGGFAATNSTDFGHYATPARCSYLEGGAIIKKLKVGFMIKEGWFTCSYSRDKYLNTLQAKDTIAGEKYYANGGDVQYSGGYGMLGIIADVNLHKFAFEGRLLGGRFTAVFPEVAYIVSLPNNPNYYYYDFTSSGVSALAVEAGVNVKYNFAKHWCAIADAGFLYAKFVYSTTVQYTDSSGSQVTGNIAYNCKFTLINTSLGIAYTF